MVIIPILILVVVNLFSERGLIYMKTEKKKELAKLSKALGNPHRIEIIRILGSLPCDSKCMVGSIVEQLPISQSTVSQHLKILKKSGWIKGHIEGPKVCYCLEENVFEYYKSLLNELKDNFIINQKTNKKLKKGNE